MGTSPDVGGRNGLGKPLHLDYFEIETTAGTAAQKTTLGIVQNTLDIPLEELGGNVWKYQANSSRPELPLNIFTEVIYTATERRTQVEEERFQKLLKQLPFSLSRELKQESRKPEEERDADFWVLEKILRFTARAIEGMETLQAVDPEGFIENNTKNHALPKQLLERWMEEVEHAIEVWKQLDKKMSASLNVHAECKENVAFLHPLIEECKEIFKKEENFHKGAFLHLQVSALALQHHLMIKRRSNALCLTTALVEAIHPILAALTMGNRASAFLPFIWALPRKEEATENVFQVFMEKLMALADLTATQQLFIKHFATVLGWMFFGAVYEAGGIPFTGEEQQGKLAAVSIRSFACQLAVCLLCHTKALSTAVKKWMEALHEDKGAAAIWKEALYLISLHLVLLASTDPKNRLATEPLLRGMKESLQTSFQQLGSVIDSENRPLLSLIHEARLQLDDLPLSGAYLDLIEKAAMPLGLSFASLIEESEKTAQLAALLLGIYHRLKKKDRLAFVINQAA